MRNGTTSLSAPARPLIAGQLSAPTSQNFAPSRPEQHGQGVAIPSNHVGITAQRVFSKINHILTPGPLAKIVIKIQQARF